MIPIALPLVVESLGWTILHFVWQGGVVAAVLYGLLAATRRASPQIRYGLACGALLVAVAAFGGTLAWQIEIARPAVTALVASAGPSPEPIVEPGLPAAAAPAAVSPGEIDSTATIEPRLEPADLPDGSVEPWPERLRAWLPLVDAMWAAGVALLSLRLCVSWQTVRRLCRSASPIDDRAWTERFAALRRRLDVSRPVRLLCSASAGVPFVVGCLRPMILVPAGLLSGLTPAEVDAILAHELAHVRRHDFAVNLVQNVAETLLFYHPAVWWISAQIRREREHCCDDVAAAACGGALDYAKALVAVEQLRPAGNLLVAASGGSLVGRIRRLAGAGPDRSSGSTWSLAALVLLLSAALAVVAVGRSSLAEPEGDQAPVAVDEPTDDAAPSESPDAGIAVAVIDAETKEPIPNFRILHGVKNSSNAEQFKKTHDGLDPIVWYRITIRLGENGASFWPAKEWDSDEKPIVLRVEADGYEPAMSAWLPKPNGTRAVLLRLVKDAGLTGRVLEPNGQPAAGATVAIALWGKWTQIENGRAHLVGDGDPPPERLIDQWALPVMAKTDGEGRFHLPGETDPGAVVVIVHESGATDMSLDDFRRQPEVRLKSWGRVVGQVWWKDHPGVGEPIELTADRELAGYEGLVRSWNNARTDVDGKFEFDKVLPGWVDISRRIKAPPPLLIGNDFPGENVVTVAGQKVDVNGTGQITSLVLGGKGRTVTAHLTGRESWNGVILNVLPSPRPSGSRTWQTQAGAFLPEPNSATPRPFSHQMWQALEIWSDSTIGPLFFLSGFSPEPDGSLKIPYVLPGSYQIYNSDPNDPRGGAIAQFTVEAEQPGVAPPALDLGEIRLDPLPPQGDQAPDAADKPADSAASNEAGSEASKAATDSAAPGITVTVLDAETGRRIQNFIILQGTRAGHVASATFAQRHPGAVPTIWAPHTLRSGKDGVIFFKPHACYEETSFRVEADGYQPQQSTWVMRPTKATVVGMRMKKDEGLSGRILQPDGHPAAGAALAVGLLGRSVQIEGAKFGDGGPPPEDRWDRWAIPRVFKTDDEGRFRLPNENDPCAVLVVVHDSGTVDMELADFQNKTEIRLKAWGRIEGQVWWKDRPGVNELIDCAVRRDTQYPHLIRSERRTRSGNDGRFEFDKVMPGRVQVLRYFELPKTEDPADNADDALTFSFDGLVPDVAAGRPTEVVFGGRGRKVVGRLAGRESWEGVTIHCKRQEIDMHVGMPGDVEMRRAYHFWQNCPIGQLYVHGEISPRADGSFEIPDVLPGDYNVFARDAESKLFVGSGVFEVESEQLSQPPATLDIGEIEVKPAEKSASSQPASEQTNEVILPDTGPRAGHEPPVLRLAVGRESDEAVVRLHGQKIDEATLKRLARALADGKGGPPVLLAAEKGTPYQEVVEMIDLLSSLGLKKVSLETRRQAADGKPAPLGVGIPGTFRGAEIIALVGPEVILARDVLPDANRTLEKARRHAVAEGPRPLTTEEADNLRKLYMAKFLERLIEIKLVVVEGRRLIPKDAWQKIEKQFAAQFDKDYLPKLLEQEQCKSRTELDLKLRKAGGSLEGLKRQSMEGSFAQYFLQEKLKPVVSSDDVPAYRKAHPELNAADEAVIQKQIAEQRRSKLRQEFLADLRKRIPVWTVFEAADQAETEQPDAAPPLPAAEADQSAGGKKPDAEPPPAPMTDEEVAAHPGTIKLLVLDSFKTPIPRFRVMTGIRADNDGLVSIQFRQFPRAPVMVDQEGGKPANWRIAPVQIGENGVCYWQPTAGQAGEQIDYMLQIEAEGYRPDTFGWISGEATREPLEFRLVREGPFTLQVIESNQQALPVAGATVAIPTPQRHAILENAHIRGDSYAAFQNESAHWGQAAFERARLDRPWLVKTATDGTCQLPDSARGGPLLVVHPRGAALMAADRITGQINYAYSAASHSQAILLSPWAVVRGNVQWRDGAGAGERIGLSVDNLAGTIRGGPDDVFTDLEGKFEFAHVLPGVAHVSRFVLDDGKLPDGKRFSFPGLDTYVTALPGANAYAKIGGKGRTVVGRLVGRKDWNGVTISLAPALPAETGSDRAGSIKKLRDLWADSPIGPIFFRSDFKPAADGSFELPRVLPGRYELAVSTPEMPDGGAARAEATIEPEDTDENRARIDLGDIDVAVPAKFGIELKAGELYRGDVEDPAPAARPGGPEY